MSSRKVDSLLRRRWPYGPNKELVHRMERCVVQPQGPSGHPTVTHVVATSDGLWLAGDVNLEHLLRFVDVVAMEDVKCAPIFLRGSIRDKVQHISFQLSTERLVHCLVISPGSTFPATVRSLWITALVNTTLEQRLPAPSACREPQRNKSTVCGPVDRFKSLGNFMVSMESMEKDDHSHMIELLCEVLLLAERETTSCDVKVARLMLASNRKDELTGAMVAGCVRLTSSSKKIIGVEKTVQLFRHLYVLWTVVTQCSRTASDVGQRFREEFRYLLKPELISDRIDEKCLLKNQVLKLLENITTAVESKSKTDNYR